MDVVWSKVHALFRRGCIPPEGIVYLCHNAIGGLMKQGACHRNQLPALRRIEGQIRGIQNMVQKKRYCIDILNAATAARGALKRVEARILQDHMQACVRESFRGGSQRDKEEKIREISNLLEGMRK